MTKKKSGVVSIREPAETTKINVQIGRSGEKMAQLTPDKNITAKGLLEMAEIKLKDGEVLEREGAVLKMNTRFKDGDIIFVTEDDGNGHR